MPLSRPCALDHIEDGPEESQSATKAASIGFDDALERRREEREHSLRRARVAYTRGAVLPADVNLIEVECHNLSRHGLAYWAIAPPEHKNVLVVLGETGSEVRIKARVIHWQVAQHDGRLRTLVGCEFVTRV
jgi:hypothetical protein